MPRLLLFLCAVLLAAATSCPQRFSLKAGHCIHTSSDNKTYCEAQKFCRSIGGELATGERVTQYPTISDGSKYLIGVSDLLDETSSMSKSKCKTSFRWTDGSFAPNKFSCELEVYFQVKFSPKSRFLFSIAPTPHLLPNCDSKCNLD